MTFDIIKIKIIKHLIYFLTNNCLIVLFFTLMSLQMFDSPKRGRMLTIESIMREISFETSTYVSRYETNFQPKTWFFEKVQISEETLLRTSVSVDFDIFSSISPKQCSFASYELRINLRPIFLLQKFSLLLASQKR